MRSKKKISIIGSPYETREVIINEFHSQDKNNILCPVIDFPTIEIPSLHSYVLLSVPMRLHVSILDINKMQFDRAGGGGIGIAVVSNMTIRVSISDVDEVKTVSNKEVVKHYLEIMRVLLKINCCFRVDISGNNRQHTGLGSTISMVTGVCYGINLLLGNHISNDILVDMIGKNYCEDTYSNSMLVRGNDSGVGGGTIIRGGISLVSNESSIIANVKIPHAKALIYIPCKNYRQMYAARETEEIMSTERYYDYLYGNIKAYLILMEMIPAFQKKSIERIGKVVYELNKLGSKRAEIEYQTKILNVDINEKIQELYDLGFDIAGMSSAGPLIYGISSNDDIIKYTLDHLYNIGINKDDIFIMDVSNNGIEILDKKI